MDQGHNGAIEEDGDGGIDINVLNRIGRQGLSDLEKPNGLEAQGVGLLNGEAGSAFGFRPDLDVIVGLALELALGTEENRLIISPLELASDRRVNGKGLLNGLVIHRLVEAN
jgi:hypothetical protein